MDLGVDKSQSSGDDEKEGEDDIVGRMEIDDCQHLKQPDQDMTEVADILLRLQVSACHRSSQLAHAGGIPCTQACSGVHTNWKVGEL